MSFLSKVFRYVNSNGDSLTFTYENGFIINKPIGIDSVTVNISQAVGINQVGSTVQSASVQPRPVTISGRLIGYFQQLNKERLMSVVRPDLEARLYADDYYLVVRPTTTPTVEPRPKFAAFQFSLLAAYPYWQKDASTRAQLSSVTGGFKFPWNMSKAYRFGTVTQTQFIVIPNNGQLPTPFTMTLLAKSECVNPRIINANTGKHLTLNKTMEAGERIVVEITHERIYVTSSVDGDIRGALSIRSNLNRLDVGDNVLKPEADAGLDQLEIAIDFATEIVGVVL